MIQGLSGLREWFDVSTPMDFSQGCSWIERLIRLLPVNRRDAVLLEYLARNVAENPTAAVRAASAVIRRPKLEGSYMLSGHDDIVGTILRAAEEAGEPSRSLALSLRDTLARYGYRSLA